MTWPKSFFNIYSLEAGEEKRVRKVGVKSEKQGGIRKVRGRSLMERDMLDVGGLQH